MRNFFNSLMMISVLFIASCSRVPNFEEGIICFRAQNYRQAFIRLLPEAMKGQPDAQYAVGYMYYYGRGVVEDRQKAMVWINRAAAQRQPDAARAVDILNQYHQLVR